MCQARPVSCLFVFQSVSLLRLSQVAHADPEPLLPHLQRQLGTAGSHSHRVRQGLLCVLRASLPCFLQPGEPAALRKDTAEGAHPRSHFLPTQPVIGSRPEEEHVKQQLRLAETCCSSPGVASHPYRGQLRTARPGDDEVFLRSAGRAAGAGRLLRVHPAAQRGVRPLEADAAGRHFPRRAASGEQSERGCPVSSLLPLNETRIASPGCPWAL